MSFARPLHELRLLDDLSFDGFNTSGGRLTCEAYLDGRTGRMFLRVAIGQRGELLEVAIRREDAEMLGDMLSNVFVGLEPAVEV